MTSSDHNDAKGVSLLLSRNVVSQSVRIVRSLVIVPLILPSELGVLRYVVAVVAYVPLVMLGTLAAFRYVYPGLFAQGELAKCNNMQRSILQFMVVGYLLSALLTYIGLFSQRDLIGEHIPFIAVLAGALLFVNYLEAFYTSRRDFRNTASVGIITSLWGLVSAVISVIIFGMYGVLYSALLVPFVVLVFHRKAFVVDSLCKLNLESSRGMLSRGIRYFPSIVITRLSTSIDILILGTLVGITDRGFGLFMFGIIIVEAISGMLKSISSVYSVRYLSDRRIDSSDRDANASAAVETDTVELYTSRDSLLFSIIVCICLIVIPLALAQFLDNYVGSMGLLGGLLIALFLARARAYFVLSLNVSNGVRWVNAGLIGSLIVVIVLALVGSYFDMTFPKELWPIARAGGAAVDLMIVSSAFFAIYSTRRAGLRFLVRLMSLNIAPIFSCAYLSFHPFITPIRSASIGIACLIFTIMLHRVFSKDVLDSVRIMALNIAKRSK